MELVFGKYVGGQFEGIFYDRRRFRGHIKGVRVERGVVTLEFAWLAEYNTAIDGWVNVTDPAWLSYGIVLSNYEQKLQFFDAEEGHEEHRGLLMALFSGPDIVQYNIIRLYPVGSDGSLGPSDVRGLQL
jgi:hypothetical protein